MLVWNTHIGCDKISPGCIHCYAEKMNNSYRWIPEWKGECIRRTNAFTRILNKDSYPSRNHVFVNDISDTFHSALDKDRPEMWSMIKRRSDLIFMMITKRVDRIKECLPDDWGDGYDNVTLCATIETQKIADEKIPLLLNIPAKSRSLTTEPLLEELHLENYLSTGKIKYIVAGGESGISRTTRVCRYEWAKSLSDQCKKYNVGYVFKQVGYNFIDQNGDTIKIRKHKDMGAYARSLNLDNLIEDKYIPKVEV